MAFNELYMFSEKKTAQGTQFSAVLRSKQSRLFDVVFNMPIVVKFWSIKMKAIDPGKYMATPLFNNIMLTEAAEKHMHALVASILIIFKSKVFFSLK